IATENQVLARLHQLGGQIMARKRHSRPDLRVQPTGAARAEPSPAQVVRHLAHREFAELPASRRGQYAAIDVRAEETEPAHLPRSPVPTGPFMQQDGDRIEFLAARAARAPDLPRRRRARKETGNDFLLDQRPDFLIAEEPGD